MDEKTAAGPSAPSPDTGSERPWHSRASGDLSDWAAGYRPSSEKAARIWQAHQTQVEPWISAAPAAGVTEARRVASAVLELLAWSMPLLDDLEACLTEESLQQFVRANPTNLGAGALGNVRGRIRRVLKAHADQGSGRELASKAARREPRDSADLVYDENEWERLVEAAATDPTLRAVLGSLHQQATSGAWSHCKSVAEDMGIALQRRRLQRTIQLRALATARRPLGRILAELALSTTAATELAALMPTGTDEEYRAALRGEGLWAFARRDQARDSSKEVQNDTTGHCTGPAGQHRASELSHPSELRTHSAQTTGGPIDMAAAPATILHDPHGATASSDARIGRPEAGSVSRRRRRPTARQARLAAAAVRAEKEQRSSSFPDSMRSYIREQYKPQGAVSDHWGLLKRAVENTLEASSVRGEDSMRKHVTHLAYFFAWARTVGLPLGPETLTRPNVGRYDQEALASASRSTRQNRRSRLLQMADQVHPEGAPVKGPPLPHRAVAAPYQLSEMAVIRRVATVQPTKELTRQMCLLVGLGAGAGIDSSDLKRLCRADVIDHGPETGIEVRVTNVRHSQDNARHERYRTVWVLREYEDLVRAGIQGVSPNQLLLGKEAERANVAASVYARAALHGDVPELAQSRLRSTWLATHLQRTTPLNLLLRAAGLTTARSLVELIEHLPQTDDVQALR